MRKTRTKRPAIARNGKTCEYDPLFFICPNCDSELMIGLPLLDIEHLAEIESLESHRPGLSERMLTLFTDSARASMKNCESAWKAGDREHLAMAVHRLKGSAASLGAMRLRMMAAELEKAALEERGEPVHANRLEELDGTLEETIAAYRQWLGRGEITSDE